jgi:hypothetical protein
LFAVGVVFDSRRLLCDAFSSADKQKTGPGRKSNAEHAIAFYEYVLETLTEDKEGEGKQNTDGSSNESERPTEVVVEQPVKKRGRGRPPKNRPKVEETPKSTEKEDKRKSPKGDKKNAREEENATKDAELDKGDDNSISVASMDTAEFINQHNDLCEICSRYV